MRKVALLFGILFSLFAQAQPGSVPDADSVALKYSLSPVDISAQVKIRYRQSGTRKDVADSTMARLFPAGNLSDLLAGAGLLTLKSYGPGTLSTMAMRGANSMQTPVIWNGINLQNINNNTVDLSLLPTFLFDQVSVSPGTSSSAWGSGAIGGAIQVNSWYRPMNVGGRLLVNPFYRTKLVCEAGSFGTFMTGYQFAYGKGKWNYDLKVYRQGAMNNFTYRNIAVMGAPEEELQHAQLLQQGFMVKVVRVPTDRRNVFGLHCWVQETHREIPPTMLQPENASTQQDYACRLLADWNFYPSNGLSFYTKAALIHEGLLYNAGYNQPISNTNAWTGIVSATVNKYFLNTKYKLLANANASGGLVIIESSSEVTEFIPHTRQLRVSAFASFGKYLRTDDEFNITLRQEMVDDKFVEPVGSAWYFFAWKSWLGLRACVSHSYRIPTFNDLYWFPGGNPDLKAETSWTEEISVEFNKKWFRTSLHYTVTAYNRNVTNMISWIPLAAYWSPINVAEVWSRGVEHRLKFTHAIGDLKFIFLANADYVRSTYEKSDDPNDVSLGKQLIYVPAWFGAGALTLEWRNLYGTYSQQYTDLKFTTRDHLEWLPSYSIGNAAIGWRHDYESYPRYFSLNVFVRCNNITNVNYQSVAWRPMPGRNFTFGFSIDFAKQKQEPLPE